MPILCPLPKCQPHRKIVASPPWAKGYPLQFALIQVVALYYSRNPLLIDTQLESPWDKGYPADCKNMQLEINFENRKTVSGVSGKVEHAKDITFGSITYFLFILADNYHGVPSK